MSKDVAIINNGRVVIRMYDIEEAEIVAQNAAKRHPGRTYHVAKICASYQLDRKEK